MKKEINCVFIPLICIQKMIFAVSPINVEEEALLSVEFEEVTSVLGEKEKSIILHVGEGYSTREIAMKFEMGKSTVNKKKNEAFLKMNPDYKPLKQRSFFLGKQSLGKSPAATGDLDKINFQHDYSTK